MNKRLCTISLFSLTVASCAGSHAEEVRDAQFKRIEDRSQALQDQADKREDKREDAIDRRYEAKEDRVKAADGPGESAQAKLLDLSKERSDYRSQVQTRMEKLATRIDATQQKLQVQGARAPTKQRDELSTVKEQYNTLKQDVMTLDRTSDARWGAKRSDIDSRIDKLNDRVSSLDDAVGG